VARGLRREVPGSSPAIGQGYRQEGSALKVTDIVFRVQRQDFDSFARTYQTEKGPHSGNVGMIDIGAENNFNHQFARSVANAL
jgi:hypothetical protein